LVTLRPSELWMSGPAMTLRTVVRSQMAVWMTFELRTIHIREVGEVGIAGVVVVRFIFEYHTSVCPRWKRHRLYVTSVLSHAAPRK
jgi:hypothetical protein